MAKKFRRFGAMLMALVMCMSMLGTTAFAKEVVNGNDWYGDELAVDVTAGTDGYTYMSLFRKPAHGYEFSGHFMGAGEGPQTFVVIDTVKYDGQTWTPSGIYAPNASNYEVAYCCDVETMIVDGTYYKRLNLEDSEYYNEAEAAKIRAIVTNSYPYVTLEAMKADLAENGYAYAEELTRNEIIAAVQTAVWASANSNGEPMRYAKSYRVTDNLQWGYPLHDTSNESGLDVSGKRVFKTYEEVGKRIDSLVDYLLAQDATYADKAQIVITKLDIDGEPATNADGSVTVKVNMGLNSSGSGYEDDISISVSVDEAVVKTIKVEPGVVDYSTEVIATPGSTITAVVAGTQVLPEGVYFYAPKEADTNGDGIATSREVSQNLVGVAMGPTDVYAKAELKLAEMEIPPYVPTKDYTITFKSGEASNISFMLIDKETGEVEFLKKIDIGGQTSFEIPSEEGKISAVFVKQSTSGMFWTSEEVSEDVMNNVISCLKKNNPSYKGYNAFCFGEGAHELEFKKNKFVTYYFNAVASEEVPEPTVPEITVPEETVPETTVPETTVPETTVPETTVPETTVPETTAPETTAPEASFHEETSKSHLLGDAEGDLATFNFKVVEEYIPAADDDKYTMVGAGEQTEFWTAYLLKDPAGELKVNGESYVYADNAKQINGIYLDGVFYPAASDAITYPGKETGSKLLANYNGLQQGMLMNGDGKKVAVYCADHVTASTSEARYSVVNIEDATHYDAYTAAKIRAVAANGYWGGTEAVNQYGTLEKVKAMMAASGQFTQEEIDHLSPGVALSATQFAIWELANDDDNRQVVNVQYIQKNRVAGYNGKSWNTLKVTPESEDACVDLIFKLSHYLTTLDPISVVDPATTNTILNYKNILTDIAIEPLYKAEGHANNADDNKDNDAYVTNVTFDMLQVSEKDNLVAKIVDANGEVYANANFDELIYNGNGTYTFPNVTLIENNEITYTVVVEGVQYLERNVYLYFAGEREISQTMIGYDEGEISVDVESSVKETFNVDEPETPPTVSFNSGEASNISFMLIDANGNVEFLHKIDIGGETSFEIPTEEGKISAVFVKQSTSGMFWTSEQVSEEVLNNVIACLEANNPSYKGYNAACYGAGQHELEFKSGKFVTYTFENAAAGGIYSFEEVKVEATEETTAPTVEVTEATEETTEPTVEVTEATEETIAPTEEPAEETIEATEAPAEEPKAPAVSVKGADVAAETTAGSVAAVYIAAEGKVPAVVWTSEEVDADTLAAIVAELGAPSDAKIVSGFGKINIEYQHNKNKTKTVTYTFTAE